MNDHKILSKQVSASTVAAVILAFVIITGTTISAWAYSLDKQFQKAWKPLAVQSNEKKAVLGQSSELDQAAYNTNPGFYEPYEYNGYYREQSFIPTLDRLTKVNLTLGGVNLNGNTPIRLAVLTPGKAIINEKTLYLNISDRVGVVFTFDQRVDSSGFRVEFYPK